jgi:hypothetical protein
MAEILVTEVCARRLSAAGVSISVLEAVTDF